MVGRFLTLAALACCAILANSSVRANDLPSADTAIWRKVKQSLFADRPVATAPHGIIELVTPTRADDAAVVPIAIRTKLAQKTDRYIRRIYLIVDNNPSPIAATFELTPQSGRADLETRIRVEQYTYVRAIAELSDGTLAADVRYVKASGGCSAAAGNERAATSVGRMRLSVEDDLRDGRPARTQLIIRHPNDSGLVMDQLTRLYTPAYYVRSLKVTYAGKPILAAAVDFSISADPNFRFYFVPAGAGELKAEVVDTNDLQFETTLAIKPRARSD